jgi:hypothetical protein
MPFALKRLTGAGRTAIASAAILAGCAVTPVFAQFGTIFGDPPPRPPANVPSRPPAPDPRDEQFLDRRQQQIPPRSQQQPQQDPSGRIGPGRPPSQAIQTEPLAPPPGGIAAPEPSRQATPSPTPGLPSGVRQPRGTPQPSNTAPQPGDEIISEPPTQKIENQQAVFSGLDKITGRIISFDVAIGETVQFGALQVVPRVCYTRPPTETPNTDAFLEVSEVTLQGEVRRIFAGWMFAASPGLHAVEHPIYDIWLTDCKQPLTKVAEDPPPAAAPQPAPQRQQQQPRPPQQSQQPAQQRPAQPRPQQQPNPFPAPIR